MCEYDHRIYLINKLNLFEKLSQTNDPIIKSLFECLNQQISDECVSNNLIKSIETCVRSLAQNQYLTQSIIQLVSIMVFTSDITSSVNKISVKLLHKFFQNNNQNNKTISEIFELSLCQTSGEYHKQNINNIISYNNHFLMPTQNYFENAFNYICIVLNHLKSELSHKLIDENVSKIETTQVLLICDLYHSCLRAIHLLLQNSKSITDENLIKFRNNGIFSIIIDSIEHQMFGMKVMPIGCIINASIVWSLIFQLEDKNFDLMIKELSEKEIFDDRTRLALISSFYLTYSAKQLNESKCFYDFKTFKSLTSTIARNENQLIVSKSHVLLNLSQIIRKILNQENDVRNDSIKMNCINDYCDEVFLFVENNFDAFSDQIEPLFRNLIQNKQILLEFDHFSKYLHSLYQNFDRKSNNTLSKFRILNYIYRSIGSKQFIDIFSSLVCDLCIEITVLLNERNNSFEIINFITVIISLPDRTIINKWIIELCASILNANHFNSDNNNLILDLVLPKLVKNHSSFVSSMLKRLLSNSEMLNCKQILSVIKLNKTLDLEIPANLYNDCMSETLSHFEDNIRLDSLSLIIESRRTTQILSKEELDLIQISFVYNLSSQQTSSRQRFLSLIKKLMQRLNDSLKTNMKALNFREAKEDYNNFIKFLLQYCFENLSLTNYFGKNLTILQVLHIINDNIVDNNEYFSITQSFNLEKYFLRLINLLNDSVEDNKKHVLQCLIKYLNLKLITLTNENLNDLREISNKLTSSINPPDSVTASYIYRLLVNIEIIYKEKTRNEICYQLISHLLQEMYQFLDSIQTDIMNAGKCPLYAKMCCIRAVIKEIDFQTIRDEKCEFWKHLMSEVIDMCFTSCTAVNRIVCNDSPQGHLPMDDQLVSDQFIADFLSLSSEQISSAKVSHITPRMLLLCGWKTFKESATVLSELCYLSDKYNLHKNNDYYILSCTQCGDITEFLFKNLMELKHPGAFIQTAEAFTVIVESVWNNKCKCSHQFDPLIASIIENLDNQNDSSLKVCVNSSRRSAGLPLVLQSILDGEPIVNNNQTFITTINKILTILFKSKAYEWQQIHCLNILKALIRDRKLAEKVNPFVEKSLTISLIKFKSKSFAVRNCASMLFNSLIIKIFGVKRVHKKNKICSRIFFSNYPSLYHFLLKEISIYSKSQDIYSKLKFHDQRDLNLPLYPLMVLLSKLMPSTSSTDNEMDDMSEFLPHLKMICLNNINHQIRVISSITYSQLSQDSGLISQINHCFKELKSCKTHSENEFQGLSLILSEIISKLSLNSIDQNVCMEWESDILQILERNSVKFSSYSMSSFLNFIDISINTITTLSSDFKSKLSKVFLGIYDIIQFSSSNSMITDEYLVILTRITIICIQTNEERIEFMRRIYSNSYSSHSEAKLLTLKLIIDSMLTDSGVDCDLAEEMSYDSVFAFSSNTLKNIKCLINNELCGILLKSTDFIQLMSDINNTNKSRIKPKNILSPFSASSLAFLAEIFRFLYYSAIIYKIKINSLFDSFQSDNNISVDMIELSVNNYDLIDDEDLKYFILLISGQYLLEILKDNDSKRIDAYICGGILGKWSTIVRLLSTEDENTLVRKIIVKIVKLCLQPLSQMNLKMDYTVDLWKSLINLIQDNDINIRKQSVEIVMKINDLQQFLVSQKALQICVQSFVKNFVLYDKYVCIYHLCEWILENNDNYNFEESDDKIFDKSKLNFYADSKLLVDIICIELELLLSKINIHINDLSLPLHLMMDFSDKQYNTNAEAFILLNEFLSDKQQYSLQNVFLYSKSNFSSLYFYRKIKLKDVLLDFTINNCKTIF